MSALCGNLHGTIDSANLTVIVSSCFDFKILYVFNLLCVELFFVLKDFVSYFMIFVFHFNGAFTALL